MGMAEDVPYFNSSLMCNICSMKRSAALEVVAELPEGQWGMFTTAQAEARGVPRTDVARLVRRELARRLRHGVHMMRVTIRRREITDREYEWVDGLPVTTPRRTLEDLAKSGRWDQSQLRTLANDAVAHGLVPASDLATSDVDLVT